MPLTNTSLVHMLLALTVSASASAARWPDVSSPVSASQIGKDDVVLVAGVGRPFVLPPIPGAADVATDWYRFFVDGRGVPVDRAVLLRDGDVTKESLVAEAERLRRLRRGSGTFWIVFVGHGAPSTNGTDGLLLGVDVQPTILSIESRGLSQRELLRAAGADDGVPVVAVFDACFSGVGSDGSGRPLVPGAQATLPVRRAPPPKRVTLLQASELVAGPLPGHDRPAFSYLLLGAVRGWADDDGDGSVKVAEAFAWVKKTLSLTVRDRSQVPTLVGPGDVILSRGAREGAPRLVVPHSDTSRVIVDDERQKPRSAVARRPAPDDTFDRVAAEAAFAKRRLVATKSGFVRGSYASAVDEVMVIETGKRLAPEPAQVISEVQGKHNVAAIGGLGLGLAGVLAGTGVGALMSDNGTNPLNIGLGAVLGTTVGAMSGLVAFGILTPSAADEERLSQARSDLAEVINDGERRRLGLTD